jgi:hypothetical protein
MFEDVDGGPGWASGVHVPVDDDLDGVLERLLADPLADADIDATSAWPGEVPDVPPAEWCHDKPDDGSGEPPLAYGSCVPSGWLALDLDSATADVARLSDHTLVEAMIGFERLTSWAQARQARLFDELARRRPTDTAPYAARWACVGSEYAPDEVGVALHLARGTACARIGLARRLLATLPDTHAAWEAGLIDTAKARAVDDATVVLSDSHAKKVEAAVLPRAPGQTLAQLKAALARAVLAVDPYGAEDRHRAARRDRRVVVTAEPDGMGTLWAMLTATDAAGALTWLTRLARGLGSEDPRSMDARRADILAALVNGRLVHHPDTDPDPVGEPPAAQATYDRVTGERLTGERSTGTGSTTDPSNDTEPAGTGSTGNTAGDPAAATEVDRAGGAGGGAAGPGPATAGPGRPIQPVTPGKPLIQIVIAHSTLIGADDQPAELAGYGPIPASLAREAAADGVWRRLVTDPLSGTLLDYGRSTYHPPAGLADHVRARDLYCRAPGCRHKAADAELDHIIAWSAGGPTSEPNLAAYCTHGHRIKTYAPGWRVHTHPDGALTWTTPTGHQHTTRPHNYRPEPPPAPAPKSPPPSVASRPTPPPDNPDPDPPPF